jgi:hypothetical protein
MSRLEDKFESLKKDRSTLAGKGKQDEALKGLKMEKKAKILNLEDHKIKGTVP